MFDFIYYVTVLIYLIFIIFCIKELFMKKNTKDAQLGLVVGLILICIPYLNTLFLIGFIIFCIYDKLVLQKN